LCQSKVMVIQQRERKALAFQFLRYIELPARSPTPCPNKILPIRAGLE
jgi:hypothetical protein